MGGGIMSKPNLKLVGQGDAIQNPLHPEKKLITRRDFISAGLMGAAGTIVIPSVLDLVLMDKLAQAADCPVQGAFPGTIPFLVFDCAGGAGLPGNWIPFDQGGKYGQPLPNYDRMGLNNLSTTRIDRQFGAPMAAPTDPLPGQAINQNDLFSQVYMVLTDDTQLDKPTRDKLSMGILCHTSLSDNGSNQLSAASLITAAGAMGSQLKGPLGQRNSVSGGNSDVASANANYRAMSVASISSLSNALSFGPAFQKAPSGIRAAVAKAINRLTETQIGNLQKQTLGTQLSSLLSCNSSKLKDFVPATSALDARNDTDIAPIYGISKNSQATDPIAIEATIVKAAIEGNSGPGVITIPGCDYHVGNRGTGDAKDRELGIKLARAIRVAALKNKPLMFQIFTDGGIASDPGTRDWAGDDNNKSLTIVGFFDPRGRREMKSFQIGQYTKGQGADTNHYIGTEPAKVAHAVLLNYLAVIGQLSRYPQIAADAPAVAANAPVPQNMWEDLLLFPNAA